MSSDSWWDQDCPKRGPALSHAHWNKCDPDGVHPADTTGNEGNKHPANMCCHCQLTEAMETSMKSMSDAAAIAIPPERLPEAMEVTDCLFHNGVTPRRVSGDNTRWVSCPSCGQQVEPRMTVGIVVGPLWGPGRGDLTNRQKDRLRELKRTVENRDRFEDWLRERAV